MEKTFLPFYRSFIFYFIYFNFIIIILILVVLQLKRWALYQANTPTGLYLKPDTYEIAFLVSLFLSYHSFFTFFWTIEFSDG